ncbi:MULTISPECIES: hypothetical protein [unclassified Leifsonia]|uniref:hypothetical protein n=1 Tax=unclassified Leifsonia TaxID=2663824 RepID=UPI00036E98BE|nr:MULTISPECIES: hypothetical protein [unclassified Leifsonia]
MARFGSDLAEGHGCHIDFRERVVAIRRVTYRLWAFERTILEGQELLGSVTWDEGIASSWHVHPGREDWNDDFAAAFDTYEDAAQALLSRAVR